MVVWYENSSKIEERLRKGCRKSNIKSWRIDFSYSDFITFKKKFKYPKRRSSPRPCWTDRRRRDGRGTRWTTARSVIVIHSTIQRPFNSKPTKWTDQVKKMYRHGKKETYLFIYLLSLIQCCQIHTFSREFTNFHTFSRNLFFTGMDGKQS
jgi:hypothetical protein